MTIEVKGWTFFWRKNKKGFKIIARRRRWSLREGQTHIDAYTDKAQHLSTDQG